ncbi:MAG: hypothetical protein U9Q81_21965 [Pseudomonadota bacterium]|nr:hypothetical protein [Pseudomonadota bacterium]
MHVKENWVDIKKLFGESFGEAREANEEEIRMWHQKVRKDRSSRGFALMWKNMKVVRDIEFSRVEPVHMGEMTLDNWKAVSKPGK